jgi:hypothetical protein
MHVYPAGAAAAADDFNVSFDPEVDLPAVAMAAGAGFGATVTSPAELTGTLRREPEYVATKIRRALRKAGYAG